MDQGQQILAPYPRPPPFYEHFTADNLARLDAFRDERVEPEPEDGRSEALRSNDVPPDLQYLVPPEPPVSGRFQTFGRRHNLNETLQPLPSDVTQLVSSSIPQALRPHELLKLSKSILLKFLELVGTLEANPDFAQVKIDDLRTLFFNAHHLVNQYRPHQARESLIAMMEDQLQRKKDEVEGVRKMKERVNALLWSLADADVQDSMPLPEKTTQEEPVEAERRRQEQRQVWEVLGAIEI